MPKSSHDTCARRSRAVASGTDLSRLTIGLASYLSAQTLSNQSKRRLFLYSIEPSRFSNSGSLAMLLAMRRVSSLLRRFIAVRRPAVWSYPTFPPPIQSELFDTDSESDPAQSQQMLGAFKPPAPKRPCGIRAYKTLARPRWGLCFCVREDALDPIGMAREHGRSEAL